MIKESHNLALVGTGWAMHNLFKCLQGKQQIMRPQFSFRAAWLQSKVVSRKYPSKAHTGDNITN